MRLSLTLSIAGHAILLGLLILLAAEIQPPPELTTKGGRSRLADRRDSDLDAGIDQMMRGAQLPPLPAGVTMSQIEVAVTIRFSLTR
jgi:hypothetical protein